MESLQHPGLTCVLPPRALMEIQSPVPKSLNGNPESQSRDSNTRIDVFHESKEIRMC